ncbi:MAG: hypothetical protein ACD_15C00073G0003 [uncultured bacterium]|nr:MAG: hypothetical protein ACD_15C00073G0003 [uncultured bacterium]HCU71143.1 hypothetical protein [Candidatus Moranbacteria bacterium]
MDNQNQNLQAKLLHDLGISDLPLEKQEELLTKMMETVLERIFVETMTRLDKKDQETYLEMIERNVTPEEAEAFVKDKIPGYNELVLEITKKFREEMIDS